MTDFEGSFIEISLFFFSFSFFSADLLRSHDVRNHSYDTSKLTYQEVYVLEGGFKSYFEHSPETCEGTHHQQRIGLEYDSQDTKKEKVAPKAGVMDGIETHQMPQGGPVPYPSEGDIVAMQEATDEHWLDV